MRALLTQLLLPPVVLVCPWLIPALRRQWGRCVALATLWAVGVGLTLFVWSGPGFLLLLALGLFALATTRVPVAA